MCLNGSLGVDHLLTSGRGAGGQGKEALELHMACFMGLVSFLASRPEVLRVAPRHETRLLNAAARANIQTATVTSTPLTDAGLDGTGEVIQVKMLLTFYSSPRLSSVRVKHLGLCQLCTHHICQEQIIPVYLRRTCGVGDCSIHRIRVTAVYFHHHETGRLRDASEAVRGFSRP